MTTITFRGSVTDLATDCAAELTYAQGRELVNELERFLMKPALGKFKQMPPAPLAQRPVIREFYKDQNPMELEPRYSQHMLKLTEEQLNAKSEIAEQLAARDMEIDRARASVLLIARAANRVRYATISPQLFTERLVDLKRQLNKLVDAELEAAYSVFNVAPAGVCECGHAAWEHTVERRMPCEHAGCNCGSLRFGPLSVKAPPAVFPDHDMSPTQEERAHVTAADVDTLIRPHRERLRELLPDAQPGAWLYKAAADEIEKLRKEKPERAWLQMSFEGFCNDHLDGDYSGEAAARLWELLRAVAGVSDTEEIPPPATEDEQAWADAGDAMALEAEKATEELRPLDSVPLVGLSLRAEDCIGCGAKNAVLLDRPFCCERCRALNGAEVAARKEKLEMKPSILPERGVGLRELEELFTEARSDTIDNFIHDMKTMLAKKREELDTK